MVDAQLSPSGVRLIKQDRSIFDGSVSVSMIGKPRSSSGRTALTGEVSPCVASSARVPTQKPSIWLPLSPMKTRAGWVL